MSRAYSCMLLLAAAICHSLADRPFLLPILEGDLTCLARAMGMNSVHERMFDSVAER